MITPGEAAYELLRMREGRSRNAPVKNHKILIVHMGWADKLLHPYLFSPKYSFFSIKNILRRKFLYQEGFSSFTVRVARMGICAIFRSSR